MKAGERESVNGALELQNSFNCVKDLGLLTLTASCTGFFSFCYEEYDAMKPCSNNILYTLELRQLVTIGQDERVSTHHC